MSKEQVDFILQGTVITMNGDFEVLPAGSLAIKNDTIHAIGSRDDIAATYTADQVLDFGDQAIIPGLVNAHTHIPMTLLRGLNDDLRLDVWLGYLMPLERHFVTPDFVRLGTQLACAEMIRSGITTFADMYYFEADIAQATAEIGMRALLGQTILIFPAPDAESYEDALILCRRFIEQWNGHPLIQPAVAPHAWYTATPEMLRACADLARAFDVPIHTHISETALEVQNCRQSHNMPPVPWNDKHGLLDTKLLAAHCVHIDRGEMLSLKKAGAGVAHCPSSNLKLASGFAPIGEMLSLGLNVGIGTDGPASNNDLDMFEETRLAALLAKSVSNDPTVLPARQALELATIGGARALHMADDTGSLEVGKRADLTVVNLNTTHNWPHFQNNPDALYSQLIYAVKSSDVTDVMCHGQWLMRDQQLLTVNEAEVKTKAAAVALEIDQFVRERESSPFNKLVALAGVERQESFEVQVKVPLDEARPIRERMESGEFEVTKSSYYRQYDSYFLFDRQDPDAARLRYRDDSYLNEKGETYQARSRLTLIGEMQREALPNAAMLSRSRYLAPATQSLRFYREYFAPDNEVVVQKLRRRWRILYENTDLAVNLDKVLEPEEAGYFLEIKSRTWSRADARRKAELIGELLALLGVDMSQAERREYVDIVSEERDE